MGCVKVDMELLRMSEECGLIYPVCPACGCGEKVTSFADDDGRFVRCDECGARTESYRDSDGCTGIELAVVEWNGMVMRRHLDNMCEEEPIAKIVWLPEDLREALVHEGFKPSDENIEVLLANRLRKTIEDLSIERGWDIIYDVIGMYQEELEEDGNADG